MSNLTWDYRSATTLSGDFPQLAACTDTVAAGVAIQAAFGAAPGRCEVYAIRYIAGRALEAVYRLGGDDLIAVRFFRPGVSASAYRAAAAGARHPALVAHMEAWGAVAWRLPADPGGLAIAELRARTADLAGGATCAILSYLPGERCAVRCAVAGGGVVGKLRSGPGAGVSHVAALQLWRTPGRRFLMPEPLAADEARGMRWERFVPGARLEEALMSQPAAPLLAAVTAGLVDLHARSAEDLPARGTGDILRSIGKVVRRISVALPDLAGAAGDLAARLAACAPPPPARAALLHGDLHTANVIVGADGPTLIDLDSLAAGDPASDLALLGSRMILSAVSRSEPLSHARSMAAALPCFYADAGGARVGAAHYAWYVAALLLARQAKTCIRNAAPDSARIVGALLTAADALLESGRVDP